MTDFLPDSASQGNSEEFILVRRSVCILFAVARFHSLSPASPAEKIVNESTMRFPYSLPGEPIEIKKVLDAEGKGMRIVSNSRRVNSAADLVALENKEAKAVRLRFGALDEFLRDSFEGMKESEGLDVVVSLIEDPLVILDKTRHSEEELKQHTLKMLTRPPRINLKTVLQKHGIHDAMDIDGQTFRVKVTKGRLRGMMFDPDIGRISTHVKRRPLQSNPPFSSLFC